ncbi:hypothetical protein DFH09DRAFT_1339671 [Mycena vulgaris]|nr:hypothetical protein DFH09DRAFT_1339671 [Mycena vulgaris]
MASNIKISVMALVAILPAFINTQAGAFSQCGGQGWTGPTTCVMGSTCTFSNPFFSQCLPSTVDGRTTTTDVPPVSSSTFAPTYSVVSIPATGTGTETDTGAMATSTPGASPITLVNFSHTCEDIGFSSRPREM